MLACRCRLLWFKCVEIRQIWGGDAFRLNPEVLIQNAQTHYLCVQEFVLSIWKNMLQVCRSSLSTHTRLSSLLDLWFGTIPPFHVRGLNAYRWRPASSGRGHDNEGSAKLPS